MPRRSRPNTVRVHRRVRRKAPVCGQTGKVRFRDRKDALLALRAARLARGKAAAEGRPTRRREVRTYRCPACSGWHITSQPQLAPPTDREATRLGGVTPTQSL